jgi:RHS repeat-associated protein
MWQGIPFGGSAQGTSWSAKAEMSYNGLGQRLSMDAAGVIAYYVMDDDRPLTAESTGNTTFYLYGLCAIGEKNTNWNFSLTDGTNTPRQLTDVQGEITLSARYTPWGDSLELHGTGNFSFGYLGGVLDATTGLLYVGNGQYYDPATGRFLTRNVNPDSTNPYVPWNPIGAIVGPLGLIALVFGRKKKGSKSGTILVLLLALGSVGMTLAGCGPAPVPSQEPTQEPTIPPSSETPIPSETPTPSQTPSPTAPPAPTSSPTQTPCPPPFTTDYSWGNSIAQKQAHVQILIPVLSSYQGEKWWEGDYPTSEEWTAYLIYAEGGILVNREDKKLMAWILLYKIPKWGTAEYTPVTNPDVSTEFEQNNFTMNDWNRLINPDPLQLADAFTILQETLLIHDSDDLPPYLYWVSKDEIDSAEAITKRPIKFCFGHHQAATWDSEYIEFLQAYEDFSKVISPSTEEYKCD